MRWVFFFLLVAFVGLVAASLPLGCGDAAPPQTTSAPSQTVPPQTEPPVPPETTTVTSAGRETLEIPDLQLLGELGQMVLSGFSMGRSDLGLFGTHVDWHSSVHAHWALLRVAAITGDTSLRDFVVGRLRSADIAWEQAMLEQDEAVEMPYGRAWLLRLVIEYERATGDILMRAFGDSVARSLEVYLSGRSDRPGLPEYGNLEWATAALCDYGQATGNEQLRESARAFGETLLDTGGAFDWSKDLRTDVGFFSTAGNTALLIAAIASIDRNYGYLNDRPTSTDDVLDVPPPRSSAHSVGLFFSRAWGLKAMYRLTGDDAFETAYSRHVETGLAELRRRASDFEGVGHWVPQFAIFALTLGE